MENMQHQQHVENQKVMETIRESIEANRLNHDEKHAKLARLVYMGTGGIMGLELILKLPELLHKLP